MTGEEMKNETLGQMKQRHKLEMRNLQNDIKNFEKKAKKEKKDKKEIQLKIQEMQQEMEEKHQKEIAEKESEEERTEGEEKQTEKETNDDEKKKKNGPTKAQRRREKKKQEEIARRERIEEANRNHVSENQVETEIILSKLMLQKLCIKDIPPDGHCLYHAVADQLKQVQHPSHEEFDFQKLRKLTSEYMRQHSDDFLPFLALEEEGGKSSNELFEAYCDRVAKSSDWGGQLELRALACALEYPIHVFAAEGDVIRMGEDELKESNKKPLMLTYHRHYYSLGEHYNSVQSLPEAGH